MNTESLDFVVSHFDSYEDFLAAKVRERKYFNGEDFVPVPECLKP